MADPRRRLPTNTPGPLYVDASCIDCDTCRWMAPATFDRRDGQSFVRAQPADPAARDLALAALVSCPTGSIGSDERVELRPIIDSFPRPVDADVFHCGFHAEASYGAASWLIRRPEGNVLVDSPRFAAPLVRRIEAMGGVATMFLTHRDDVADHEKWARRFGCRRVMMRADIGPATRDVEVPLDGDAPIALAPDLVVVPTPGHTRGSACLHWRDRYLFTGDTLAWDPVAEHLYAFEDACWYDWDVLRDSLRQLADLRFRWVLPGHGAPVSASPEAMREYILACIARMSE